ncbi:MAG: heat-inducible transcriptional repressor HrcA [Pseudomonadales bacterium]
MQDSPTVDERAQVLLKHLVEHYIEEGTPAASKVLAAQPGVQVSPATVRNIMGELESHGLVRSPHTSAGKIPTQQGLRFFVDSLLAVQPVDQLELDQLASRLNPDMAPKELVTSASKLLSHLTSMTCMVLLPRQDAAALRHVEFLPLSGNRALVILVLNDREVQNRVIHLDREYSDTELTQAANFINREYGGRPLSELRELLLADMQNDKDRMDELMQSALDLASRALESDAETDDQELLVSGESALLNIGSSTESVRSLFDTFTRKGNILHLLDRCLQSDGIQLFIGEEAGSTLFEEVSVVTSRYQVNGQVAGVLGVVGPTRMAYQKVIPVVDVTAKVLGAAMSNN